MPFHRHTTANGLQIIGETIPTSRSVGVGFFVNTGARDETTSESGVSHFLEHMMFKGSKRRTALEVNLDFDRIGADYNAYTSEEMTVYYASVLPEYLMKAVDVWTDILRPTLRQADFDMEKQVILEEIEMYADNPAMMAWENARAIYFGNHPLGQSILGTTESVTALTDEAMRHYFERRYVPSNIVVAVAGQFDWDATVQQIETSCADWPNVSAPRQGISPALGQGGKHIIRHETTLQEHVLLMSPCPAADSPLRYALAILTIAIGDDSGSRLYWELVDPGLVESASCGPDQSHGNGFIMTTYSSDVEQAPSNLEIVQRILADVQSNGLTEEEFEQAKNKVESRLVRFGERSMGRMRSIASTWIYQNELTDVEIELNRYDAVTLADVRACLDQFPPHRDDHRRLWANGNIVMSELTLREQALDIWHHAVEAVQPARLISETVRALSNEWHAIFRDAERIVVVGGGKAGAGMAQALETALSEHLDRIEGIVNIPEGTELPTQRIRLHPARPQGSNHPTEAGVRGTAEILQLVQSCGPNDIAIMLLSGGGSALMPLPIDGITLEQKQAITAQLHKVGATITEMNTVRKHLSQVKGGRLAEAFGGQRMLTLIISDVIGDPIDVIASGPTAADTSTLDDVDAILNHYGLNHDLPKLTETPKILSDRIENRIIGSNAMALEAAKHRAYDLGFTAHNLGSNLMEGDASISGPKFVWVINCFIEGVISYGFRYCIALGGETTVDLEGRSGKGGRNQEWTLAALDAIPKHLLKRVCILSAGTDGEDGPTDAAGAVADAQTWERAIALNLDPKEFLKRHDSYNFFDQTESLIRTGLTGTNVMDVAIILIR